MYLATTISPLLTKILSISFIRKKAASGAKKSSSSNKREDSPMIQNQAASTTLGDIDALAALKEQLEGKK